MLVSDHDLGMSDDFLGVFNFFLFLLNYSTESPNSASPAEQGNSVLLPLHSSETSKEQITDNYPGDESLYK